MSFEARRAHRTGTDSTQRHDAELRAALAELRAANLEIVLDDMRNQRDLWRARAERPAVAREACRESGATIGADAVDRRFHRSVTVDR
jgi:hypothetical protein